MDIGESLKALEEYFNELEPVLQAFVPEGDRFERLQAEANALRTRYSESGKRPPLFGSLLGVKDIFHVDGFPTAAGSRLPPEALSGPKAECVTQLIEAGALIAGKTNTTEFAYFAPGPTRNPHNPEHTPGGSSSGSAAAVAAGAVPLALGTQTIGSIVRPAAYCGVVGYKPTYDRISRQGVIPLAPSVDHVGLFAASVSLTGQTASVLCQGWGTVSGLPERPVLGVPEGPYLQRVSAEGQNHFEEACRWLGREGFAVKPVKAMADFDKVYERHYRIVAAEAAVAHEKWFSRYENLYHPKTADLIRRGQAVPAEELSRALSGRMQLRDEFSALMDRHAIDLWISPAATGPAPRGLESTGDPVMNLPWTHAGLPALSLPAGADPAGLPLGLQVVARWGADEALLYWGSELEQALASTRHAS